MPKLVIFSPPSLLCWQSSSERGQETGPQHTLRLSLKIFFLSYTEHMCYNRHQEQVFFLRNSHWFTTGRAWASAPINAFMSRSAPISTLPATCSPAPSSWEDGRTYQIDAIRDFRPAISLELGHSDRYTVVIHGKERYLYFEKTGDQFICRMGRWYVETNSPV